jgi:hypothetical protein
MLIRKKNNAEEGRSCRNKALQYMRSDVQCTLGKSSAKRDHKPRENRVEVGVGDRFSDSE